MNRSKKSVSLLSVIIVLTVLFFTGCPGSSPAGTGETEIPDTTAELYETLNLEVDDSPAVNGNGETVSGTMNPLGAKINEIDKVYEIAQVGATISGGLGPYSLSDHSSATNSGFSVKSGLSGADQAWMDFPKKSLAADMDQDGKDNVITAVFNADGSDITSYDFMADFRSRTWLTDSYLMRDFTTGDFDGDRLPDFAGSCMTGVLIFDGEFNLLGSLELPDKGGDGSPYVRVEAGT